MHSLVLAPAHHNIKTMHVHLSRPKFHSHHTPFCDVTVGALPLTTDDKCNCNCKSLIVVRPELQHAF